MGSEKVKVIQQPEALQALTAQHSRIQYGPAQSVKARNEAASNITIIETIMISSDSTLTYQLLANNGNAKNHCHDVENYLPQFWCPCMKTDMLLPLLQRTTRRNHVFKKTLLQLPF